MNTPKEQSFLDRCIRDKNNHIVLFQKPNLTISVWFVSLVLEKLTSDKLSQIFSLISYGAIFTWAWLELFKGVNYARRLLGLIVLVAIIANKV